MVTIEALQATTTYIQVGGVNAAKLEGDPNYTTSASVIVPAGQTYSYNGTNGTLRHWAELR